MSKEEEGGGVCVAYNRYFSYRSLAIHSDNLFLFPLPPLSMVIDVMYSRLSFSARQYQTARLAVLCSVYRNTNKKVHGKTPGFCYSPIYDATNATEIVNEALDLIRLVLLCNCEKRYRETEESVHSGILEQTRKKLVDSSSIDIFDEQKKWARNVFSIFYQW